MAKKRTPQTFEKRARERDKQVKRQAKQAERLARNAAKRDAREDQPEGGLDPNNRPDFQEHPDRLMDESAPPTSSGSSDG